MAPYLFQHVVVKCRVVVFIIVLVNPGVSTDKVMRVKGFYSLNTIKFGSPLTRRDFPRFFRKKIKNENRRKKKSRLILRA